jgi:hypothetical protein
VLSVLLKRMCIDLRHNGDELLKETVTFSVSSLTELAS